MQRRDEVSRGRAISESVRERFANYRPGNGEESPSVPAVQLAPIVHRKGDEKSAAFWRQFASGASDRLVDKATAIYVVSCVVNATIGGGRGNQAIVMIKEDPTTVADVLSTIEKLCGGPGGWQTLQKRAGY